MPLGGAGGGGRRDFQSAFIREHLSFGALEGLDLDTAFTGFLRDIRSHLTGDRSTIHQYAEVTLQLLAQTAEPRKLAQLQPKLASVIKGMLVIGAGLSIAKEVRDLFEDLIDKVVKPLREVGFSAPDSALLCDVLMQTFGTLEEMKVPRISKQRFDTFLHSWTRFLLVIKICVGSILTETETPSDHLSM